MRLGCHHLNIHGLLFVWDVAEKIIVLDGHLGN